jgi:hypothetical protein
MRRQTGSSPICSLSPPGLPATTRKCAGNFRTAWTHGLLAFSLAPSRRRKAMSCSPQVAAPQLSQVPLLAFVFLINGLAGYVGQVRQEHQPGLAGFLGSSIGLGPMWFVAALLTFSLAYALVREAWARAWPCRPTPTRPASGTQCRHSPATIASLPAHGSCHRSSALAMAPAWPQTRSRRCWPATATGTTRRPARIQRPRPPGAEPISHPSLPSTPPSWTARSQCLFPPHRLLRRASRHLTRSCWPRAREIALRKCHEFETDLGARVVRQLRKPRSGKINMSREVRPYSQDLCRGLAPSEAVLIKRYRTRSHGRCSAGSAWRAPTSEGGTV